MRGWRKKFQEKRERTFVFELVMIEKKKKEEERNEKSVSKRENEAQVMNLTENCRFGSKLTIKYKKMERRFERKRIRIRI